jgi:hypothetical protein
VTLVALEAIPKRSSRIFHLTVQPSGETFGVRLVEADEKNRTKTLIAMTNPARTREVTSSIQRALKDSGHSRTSLGNRTEKPLQLQQDAGVRLALIMFAIDGVKKGRRKMTMMSAIEAMATEEAYYWYAKCVSPIGQRARRALRLFLADE